MATDLKHKVHQDQVSHGEIIDHEGPITAKSQNKAIILLLQPGAIVLL